MLSFTIDIRQVSHLREDFRRSAQATLRALTERGAVITAEEEPKRSGTLRKGTHGEVDLNKMSGRVIASALRAAIPSATVTMQTASGRTKSFTMRAQRTIDYASFVRDGTGIYGARGQAIKPKKGKALRFEIGGRTVFRVSVQGQKPNPFDERAADRLENEAESIFMHQTEGLSNP